jgi:glycine/D-amino acid oxidase-like deaminating enzyme/nitrite reductase/ring-hydroxylating ferredoxin subunit
MARAEDGTSVPIWVQGLEAPTFPALERDLDVEVAIVGAGIAGMSVAYELACCGVPVAVIDDGSVGGGQTQRTTAHLASAIDDRFTSLEKWHGAEAARIAAASHAAAIDRIERIVEQEAIDCGFERVDGFLFLGRGKSRADLDLEYEAARRAGLAPERLDISPFPGLGAACIRFPRQAQIHPLRYLHGLARGAAARGALVFEGTHVARIEEGEPVRLSTSRGASVRARNVVVATNAPIHTLFALHTKQAAYRSFVIGLSVPEGSVQRALCWDMEDPYHYVRLCESVEPAQEVLLVGGEDRRLGTREANDAGERHAALERWARDRFPALGPVVHRWSGEVMEPVDGLAFIGASPGGGSHLFVATGDSGMGMTHGAIAGMLLRDLVLHRPSPWASLYDPSRKPVRAALEYARENLETAAHYLDWLRGGDASLPEIAVDSGAVVREGLRKLAVYRDPDGALHVRSATCPHLGCVVAWNGVERTWDCPCHGSRFDRFGRVVHGPANRDLAPEEPPGNG